MGIKLTYPANAMKAELAAGISRVDMLMIRALSRLGEECVRVARDRSPQESWIDRTGNLRSSVGYIIARDGRTVSVSGFQPVNGASEGSKAGREFAEEIVKRFTKGYALVVVAGMNYAEYVEAMDSKDVLATPELYARKRLPEMIKKFRQQIMK